MKANAPDKLYYAPYGDMRENHPITDNDIEYIRKDAFIEMALKWYCLDCECNDNCKDSKCFFHNEFKRYLEGNEHAIPPKFETAILNPDGSTTENWRYRHFIRKMQDTFIEKAAEWIKENLLKHTYVYEGEVDIGMAVFLEEFKQAMEGE